MLEGRKFKIYTDQKPLTSAFLKGKDPISNRQRHQLAFISEFATDIAHVPGVENIVADALSRQYDDEPEAAIVHSVSHALADVSLDQIAQEQRPLSEEPSSSLQLREIRFPGINGPVVCDVSRGRPRVLVPEGRRREVFDAIHGLAHPSGRATLSIVARTYAWENMRRDVISWARQCTACAASKIAAHTRPGIIPIPVPETRFSHVHVDVVGPLPPDQGYRYLLTMLDRTTRWPEAVPIPDAGTNTIMQAFLGNWVSWFGIPETITSDRGAQFTSDAWKRAVARLGINTSTTTTYHPQANGLVERFHRTLKNALRCSVRASSSWTRSLPWVMLGLRNAPKSDTSTSTAEVVFGTPLRVPGLCFQDGQSPGRTVKEQLQRANENVRSFSPETLDLRKFKESPFVAKSMRTASYVYVRDDRLGRPSLAPKYVGPYKVLEKIWSDNTFRVDMGRRKKVVSLSRLKAAAMPPEAT